MSTPIVILAGGSSSRMAPRHKLLERVDGQPLLHLQASRALAVSEDVHVILRPGFPALAEALNGLAVQTHLADEALDGIGGSIRAATQIVKGADQFLSMLGDLVDVDSDDLRTMLDAPRAHPQALIWQATTQNGAPGHPILFARAVYPDLLALTGDEGGRSVVQKYAARVAHIPLPGQHARTDLDTREDWARWRKDRDEGPVG